MNTALMNNQTNTTTTTAASRNRTGLLRFYAACALMVAGLGIAALGSAASSHADAGTAGPSTAPGHPHIEFTHPAFPHYPGGLPGYSPSPHIHHRHAHRG